MADAQHTVFTACVNLRSQCEALAKEKGLYSEKRGGWITWFKAQQARVRCLDALNTYKGTDVTLNKQMLMDAIVLTIFTYGPVDRVGIIRKLRLNDTLVRGDDGSYSVDLTTGRCARTSRPSTTVARSTRCRHPRGPSSTSCAS